MNLYRVVLLAVVFFNMCCYADQQNNEVDASLEPKKEVKQDNKIQKEQMVTVGIHAFGSGGIYLTAHEAGKKIQSLMWIAQVASYQFCLALAPEKTTVDYVKNVNNPIYDSKINILHMHNDVPLIVTQELPHAFFLVQHPMSFEGQSILSGSCNDACEHQVGAIKAVAHGNFPHIQDQKYYDYIFAAVAPQNGIFGQPGSGLSVIKIDNEEYTDQNENEKKATQDEKKEEKKVRVALNILDSVTGKAKGNKAFALDQTNEVININNGLKSIGENVVLCFHPAVNRLYIGLQVQTTSDAQHNQGANALLVGRLHNNIFSVEPMISFDNLIIPSLCAATGADKHVSIHHLKPYYPSTRIAHLLVVGGQGEEAETRKNVYALPLVDIRSSMNDTNENNFEMGLRLCQDSYHGRLASTNDSPVECYRKFNHQERLQVRCMKSMDYDEVQFSYEDNKGVRVGAQGSLPGPIECIETVADAVYVTVKADGDEKAGVFHSQPIFDGSGKIAAWTPWQRVAGTFEGVVDFKTKQDSCDTVVVKAAGLSLLSGTQWHRKNKELSEEQQQTSLIEILNALFNYENGGISCMENISLHDNKKLDASLLLCGGDKKVVLAEIAKRDNSGKLLPYGDDYSVNRVCGQDIKKNDPSKPWLIEFTSDVLNKLGFIESAAMLRCDDQSWIVIGSNEGLAVLADKEGRGIMLDMNNITQLYFQLLGDIKHIKKLIVDNDKVYILTNTELFQLQLTSESIKHNKCCIKRLVADQGFLFDAGVSDGFVILASNKGLLINDVYTRIDDCALNNIKWHPISLPRMQGYHYKLFFVNPTNNENRLSNLGQIYVLTGSMVENYTAVYRLFFNADATRNDSLIQWVPDIEFKEYPGAFCSFNNFKNIFVTDGAHQFVAHPLLSNKKKYDKALLYLMHAREVNRTFITDDKASVIELGTKKATKITALIQNSATGNWFVAGNFGLLANY